MTDTTLAEIAGALVAHCRAGTEAEGLATLYAPDAVSVEGGLMPGADSQSMTGVEAIRNKHAWWEATFEVTSFTADGPFLHAPDRFAVIFAADTVHRETGKKESMREVAVYTVREGKIVREEFFYAD